MLSESKTGFILNWLLYTEKNENNNLSNIICKLCMNYVVKINERKRCVFHNNRNDKKTSYICETCG